jgi:hypothetical protein
MTQEQVEKLQDYLGSEKVNVTGYYLRGGKTRIMEITGCINAKQVEEIAKIVADEVQLCAIEDRNDNTVIAFAWKEK